MSRKRLIDLSGELEESAVCAALDEAQYWDADCPRHLEEKKAAARVRKRHWTELGSPIRSPRPVFILWALHVDDRLHLRGLYDTHADAMQARDSVLAQGEVIRSYVEDRCMNHLFGANEQVKPAIATQEASHD